MEQKLDNILDTINERIAEEKAKTPFFRGILTVKKEATSKVEGDNVVTTNITEIPLTKRIEGIEVEYFYMKPKINPLSKNDNWITQAHISLLGNDPALFVINVNSTETVLSPIELSLSFDGGETEETYLLNVDELIEHTKSSGKSAFGELKRLTVDLILGRY